MTLPLKKHFADAAARLKQGLSRMADRAAELSRQLSRSFAAAAGKAGGFVSAAAKKLKTSFQAVMLAGALASMSFAVYTSVQPMTTRTMEQSRLEKDCAHNFHRNLPCSPEGAAALKAAQEEIKHIMLVDTIAFLTAFTLMCIAFPTPEMRGRRSPAPKA